jgi:hypothetical protein
MLENQSLIFVRADLFGDKFEGKLPEQTANNIDEEARRMIAHGYIKKELLNFSETFNRRNSEVYINCWCYEKHEMVHMWKIYSKENGLAIETDYVTLKESIKSNEAIYPTLIDYIDFKKDLIHWQYNELKVYTLKRKEYKSEKEFRLILSYPIEVENQLQKNESHENLIKLRHETYKKTPIIKCNVDVIRLIKKIHLSPFAPSWYIEIIKAIADKYHLEVRVIDQSEL